MILVYNIAIKANERDPMREKTYIVQFCRVDGQPDEEYYYNDENEAERHFRLFQNDDSGLYTKINLLAWIGDITTVLRQIEFPNG